LLKGGGYIYHSDHSVPKTVSFQQYSNIIELVKKYGVYSEYEEISEKEEKIPIKEPMEKSQPLKKEKRGLFRKKEEKKKEVQSPEEKKEKKGFSLFKKKEEKK